MTDQAPIRPDALFDESILISPPFSCGAGLLMDILLRLQVRVRPPQGDFWIEGPGGFSPSALLKTHYARHVTSMSEQDVYSFTDRKSVMFEHRLDLAAFPGRARILLVRDPIDAVFSWYRRWELSKSGLSFEAYLNNFSYFPHHLPHGALLAKPLDVYALFVLFWALADDDLLVVRYEDLKQDPVCEVSRILAAIGAERSDAEIAEAAHLSSFDAIRSRTADKPEWNTTNLRSQIYEWRQRMSPAERGALTMQEPIASVCRLLSYEAPDGDGNIFEHASVCGTIFSGMIRALRVRFPEGLAEPVEFFAGCMELASSLSSRVRRTVFNDISVDAGDLDAVASMKTAIRLLRQVFANAGPQPVPMLESLVSGLSAVFANSAANAGLRHIPDGIESVS